MNARLNIRHLFNNMDIIINHKIEKALKSKNPFVLLDELFSSLLKEQYFDIKVVERYLYIFERGLKLAISNNDTENAYKSLFKIINYSNSYDRYPMLIEFAFSAGDTLLIKSMMNEVLKKYYQGSLGKSILEEISDIFLKKLEMLHPLINVVMEIFKICLDQKILTDALAELARINFEAKNFDIAKIIYLELLKYKCRDRELFESLAHIYIKENKHSYAYRHFEEALALNTENLELILYFGTYYYSRKEYCIAKKLFLLHDALDSEFLKGKEILANIFLREDNYDDALFYIQQISDYHMQNGDKNKIYEIFEGLIKNKKGSIEIRSAYINALECIGDYKAVKEQNIIIGVIYYKKREILKALEHFLVLYDLAQAQGDYFYQQKVLEYVYQIQTDRMDFKAAVKTIKELISISQEINDIRSLDQYRKECFKLEIQLGKLNKLKGSSDIKNVMCSLRDCAKRAFTKNSTQSLKPQGPKTDLESLRNADKHQKDKIINAIKMRRQGRDKEAKVLLINIIKDNPNIPTVYQHLFHIFLKERDLIACKKVMSKALKIRYLTHIEKALFLCMFGNIFLKMSNYDKALKYYRLAYSLDTKLALHDKIEHIYKIRQEKLIENNINRIIGPMI